LAKDVAIMQQLNLMDYSLLLCIEDNPDYVSGLNDGTIGMKHRDNSLVDYSRGMSAINSDAVSIDTLKSNEREILEYKFDDVKTRHKFLSKDCKHIYHLGIIDYL